MSENKSKQNNPRVYRQEQPLDEHTSRTQSESYTPNSSYQQSPVDYQQSHLSRNSNYPYQAYSNNYNAGYPVNPYEQPSQYQAEWDEPIQRGAPYNSLREQMYRQGNPWHNEPSLQQSQQTPTPYNSPYQNPYQNPYQQPYASAPYNTTPWQHQQQYGTPQPLSTQFPTNYNPGQWNQGYHRGNLLQESAPYGQQGNYPGTNLYNPNTNWMGQNQSSYRVGEQGNLYNNATMHKGKGPKGYRRSDDRIKEDISDRLMEDGLLDATDINVEVENNEVILNGTVENRDSKRRAEYLTESIPGVNNVENRLHVEQNKEWTGDRRPYTSSGSESKTRRGSLAGSES